MFAIHEAKEVASHKSLVRKLHVGKYRKSEYTDLLLLLTTATVM
jgi:hypothetical protein